jgi:hypothetical protein
MSMMSTASATPSTSPTTPSTPPTATSPMGNIVSWEFYQRQQEWVTTVTSHVFCGSSYQWSVCLIKIDQHFECFTITFFICPFHIVSSFKTMDNHTTPVEGYQLVNVDLYMPVNPCNLALYY